MFSLPEIDTPSTCYRRLVSVSDVNIGLAKEWNHRDGMRSSVYVGPLRNSTSEDAHSPVPIVCLVPYTREATVNELFLAWVYYVNKAAQEHHPCLPHDQKKLKHYTEYLRRKGLQHLIGPYRLTYNREEIDVHSGALVADVIDNTLRKHYFVISGDEWTDNRDIGQLAEFIEGKTGEKEKKKRKKRKDSSRDALERDQEGTSASLVLCPPAERLKNMTEVCGSSVSREENDDKVGKHKNSKIKDKVNLEANLELMEEHNLYEKGVNNCQEVKEESTT